MECHGESLLTAEKRWNGSIGRRLDAVITPDDIVECKEKMSAAPSCRHVSSTYRSFRPPGRRAFAPLGRKSSSALGEGRADQTLQQTPSLPDCSTSSPKAQTLACL